MALIGGSLMDFLNNEEKIFACVQISNYFFLKKHFVKKNDRWKNEKTRKKLITEIISQAYAQDFQI